jgi:hypothetical protein
MQQKEVFIEDGQHVVFRQNYFDDDMVAFLDQVRFGTRGAVYRHSGTAAKIPFFVKPHVFRFEVGGVLGGMVLFLERLELVAGQPVSVFYVRYFAAAPSAINKGLMTKYGARVMVEFKARMNRPSVCWAMVEKKNLRSFKVVSKVGYAPFTTMKLRAFSRFFPRADARLQQVTTEEGRQEVRADLRAFYAGHNFWHEDYLFSTGEYYVLHDEKGIIAGLQVRAVKWKVEKMPGLVGLAMKIAPHIPILGRMYQSDGFRFLAMESWYFRPGCAAELLRLSEAVLAHRRMYTAMYFVDERSPYLRALEMSGVSNGLFHTFVKNENSFAMASFERVPEPVKDEMLRKPVFLAAFDTI